MTEKLSTINTIQMDSKLNELLADVQQQLLAETTRRKENTETAWFLVGEDLPLDFTDYDVEEASRIVEQVIRTQVNNGLPPNEMDYAVHLAQEFLNDVDFQTIALRLGAQEQIT